MEDGPSDMLRSIGRRFRRPRGADPTTGVGKRGAGGKAGAKKTTTSKKKAAAAADEVGGLVGG